MALTAAACGGDDDDSSSGDGDESDAAATADVGGSSPDTGPATGSAGDPGDARECTNADTGGELTVGIRNEPAGFDPTVAGSVASQGGLERTAVFDRLMRYDPETGEASPRMAKSLTSNPDLTEWTLTLRDDVTFANGEPVNSQAVRFSVERHRAEDSTSFYRSTAQLIDEMEIVDDHTMVFHLTDPWGNFPTLLAGPVGQIIHPGTFKELGAEGFAQDPQGGGAGAYRLARWSPGEEIVMEARDDYWDGPVCIETLRFVRVEDNDARYQGFEQGELDLAFVRSATDFAQAREDDLNLHTSMNNGGLLLMINNGVGDADRPGEDVRIRKAIAYALEPSVIDKQAFDGVGWPSSALLPESSVLYTDAIQGTSYDPDKARALLEAVKAETGYDGSLHFMCNDTYAEPAITIEALLEAVGFEVDNDSSRSVSAWVEVMNGTTDYDITCHSLSSYDSHPWASLAFHLGTGGDPGPHMGYADPAMTEAMGELREADSLEARQAAMAQVQDLWNETVPSAIYSHVEEGFVWSDEVEGLEFTRDAVAFFDDARIAD